MGAPHRDVAVTGMGIVSPLGDDLESFWQAMLRGTVATAELRRFDVTSLSSDRGAEVPGAAAGSAEPAEPLALEFVRRASRAAVDDAGLAASGIPAERVGVCVGSVMTTRPAIEPWLAAANGELGADPLGGAWASPARLSREPARELGFDGPNSVISSACASGNSAIALGAALLHSGRADAMVVAGVDELSQAMLLMFDSFKSLTPDAVRPFDRDRLGLLLGEGAAALVLEPAADARARGRPAYGRILGCANTADAYHVTAPHPDGAGAIRAMRRALERAGIGPGEVDHISSHGTGTPSNDAAEAAAIRAVFGGDGERIPVSALKSMLGHTQGAASAIEAVACLLAIRDGAIPPIANHETRDPGCDLDLVTGSAREGRIDVALSNAFGFGGNIECVVLGAP